jgi:hypothetical protein
MQRGDDDDKQNPKGGGSVAAVFPDCLHGLARAR